MTDSPTAPVRSSEEAKILLGAAEAGTRAGSSVSRSTAGVERGFAVVLGICVALFLLSGVYIYPLGNVPLTVAVTAVYVTAIAGAIVVFARVRRGSSAGWNRRYVVGFIATMMLYTGGIVIHSLTDATTPLLWAPYAIATALPVIVASVVRSAR